MNASDVSLQLRTYSLWQRGDYKECGEYDMSKVGYIAATGSGDGWRSALGHKEPVTNGRSRVTR